MACSMCVTPTTLLLQFVSDNPELFQYEIPAAHRFRRIDLVGVEEARPAAGGWLGAESAEGRKDGRLRTLRVAHAAQRQHCR